MTAYRVVRRPVTLQDTTYQVGEVIPAEAAAVMPRPESWVRAGMLEEVKEARGGKSGGVGTRPRRGRPRKQDVEATEGGSRSGGTPSGQSGSQGV